ncbi:DUF2283 domain-containing protein [Patescibacteria group bacterium]|nr:DUF2283 domain-containing protein [Patescibacteria group bacterium]
MSPSISYDPESEVLSIELVREPSVDSDMQGNVVIDYGVKGKPVKINIYKFSFENFKKSEKDLKKFADIQAI